MNLRIEAVLGLLLLLCPGQFAEEPPKCDSSDPCRCNVKGSVINFEPLGFTNGSASFTANKQDGNTTIASVFYNPCKSFTIAQSECSKVAACVELNSTIGTLKLNYGNQEEVQWTAGDNPKVNYKYGLRSFELQLHCAKDAHMNDSTFELLDVTNSSVTAKLTSVCACPGGCPGNVDPPPTDKATISFGTILVITFFVTVTVYLVAGIIFKKIMHGATGKELIPNIEFWSALPKLVLDGVAFTCNCCRSRRGTAGYDDV